MSFSRVQKFNAPSHWLQEHRKPSNWYRNLDIIPLGLGWSVTRRHRLYTSVNFGAYLHSLAYRILERTPVETMYARLPAITKRAGFEEGPVRIWGVDLADDCCTVDCPTRLVFDNLLRFHQNNVVQAEEHLVRLLRWRRDYELDLDGEGGQWFSRRNLDTCNTANPHLFDEYVKLLAGQQTIDRKYVKVMVEKPAGDLALLYNMPRT